MDPEQLQVRMLTGRKPEWGSACWEVCQVPGLYVFKFAGSWQAATQLQQRSLAYRIWHLVSNQRFQTRRDTLQAIQHAWHIQQDRYGA